ncbi:hypothetical protein BT96DRAFT_919408 [Gymnopus androsaceus JB14]|uniref:Uncharacterized protein n=1 Tax=Gymnopus androsaceus JB14 TaxID=1447944 RepID=A0A6A4HQ25_9AGAR|nr:hypothetical protein BT96DRAFT_919408 [Gymnopus androsaceus JB14]
MTPRPVVKEFACVVFDSLESKIRFPFLTFKIVDGPLFPAVPAIVDTPPPVPPLPSAPKVVSPRSRSKFRNSSMSTCHNDIVPWVETSGCCQRHLFEYQPSGGKFGDENSSLEEFLRVKFRFGKS